MIIFGRIFGIGHIIAKRIIFQFSPEAFWRLKEITEDTRSISEQALTHAALSQYSELDLAYRNGYTHLRLVTNQGREFLVDLPTLLQIKQLRLPLYPAE